MHGESFVHVIGGINKRVSEEKNREKFKWECSAISALADASESFLTDFFKEVDRVRELSRRPDVTRRDVLMAARMLDYQPATAVTGP